jgi:amidase
MKYLFTLFMVIFFLVVSIGSGTCRKVRVPDGNALHNLLLQMVNPGLESETGLYGPAPGAVLQVDGSGFHFLEAAGYADLEKKTLVHSDARFEIGSNTKMFTATLLVQLAEQGILGIDDDLAKWLPGWAAKIPDGDRISLRMLASHTSGIRDYADDFLGAGMKDDDAMRRTYTPEELVQYALAGGSSEFSPVSPAKQWKYSNTGYILLGMALEKATGKKYRELLEERIIRPLALKNTTFPDTVPDDPALVRGYVSYPGGKDSTAWNLSQGWAAGGIISTAEDMRIFLQALANGTLFKDKSTLLAMAEFVRNSDVNKYLGTPGYGLGLIEYARGVWGHDGQTLGFESAMMFVPGTDISMVVLTNAAQGPALQMRSLALVLQKMAGIEPETVSVFPRPEPDYSGKRSLDFKPFVQAMNTLDMERVHVLDRILLTATVPQIQQLLRQGKTSSKELALYYLSRIQAYDWNLLNSVIELDPRLLENARQLDSERAAGKTRGSLHGIPVLLKDNIAVRAMHTTAGAWAMNTWLAGEDAGLVKNLRKAGALILGKTNLSEWANYMDPSMPSGFSVLGGQTRNPYGSFDVWGSSSGSAVAASANFAPVTVGTETTGSIIQPASINGVVAIKPSHGLVSSDNIIPLVDWMDVPGPMGRTVTDVAVLLGGMVGRPESDYTGALSLEKAQGMRVGVIVLDPETAMERAGQYGFPEEKLEEVRDQLLEENRALREAAAGFKGSGVKLVEISGSELPPRAPINTILAKGFRNSLNKFFKGAGRQAPVSSLAEIIGVNDQDPANRAPYGQHYLITSRDSKMSDGQYRQLVEKSRTEAAEALAGIFNRHRIAVLISNSQAYAVAGFPAITVPAGYRDNGEPHGLFMLGNQMGEADLVTAGYTFEQTTRARKLPNLDTTIQQIMKVVK